MTFLAPLMLWGSLAAGIPIALHFFFRSRYRTVPWAAMKFLLTSIEQTSRRLKFQELLLLLCRVAILVFLALALARPLSSSIRGAGRGEAVDAVFLFDVSYSMGASDGGKTRLERAQESANEILKQLPAQSTIQIIACSDQAVNLGPIVPSNREQARTIIDELQLSSQATDMSAGVALAKDVIKRAQAASNKELYVFSDMQKSGWEKEAAKIKQELDAVENEVDVTLVRCGQPDFKLKNVAVVGLTPQSGIPRPGERADFAVSIRNTGQETVKDLEVSLLIDGDPQNGGTEPIPKLTPGETRVITISGKVEKAGLRTITAQVKHDDLPGDNRFDYVLQVRDHVNVLVIDGGDIDPDDDEKYDQASSYRLMLALRPVSFANLAKYYLQTTRIRPNSALPSQLNKKDVCILVNVAMPPADQEKQAGPNVLTHRFLEELSRFVREGRSLIVYGGDRLVPKNYNESLGKLYGLLPLPIRGDKAITFDPKDPRSLNRNTFSLAAYQKFKDKHYESFSKIKVFQAFDVEEPMAGAKKDEKATSKKDQSEETVDNSDKKKRELLQKDEFLRVALRYSNGMPAVVARRVGAGEVFFITTAAEPGPLIGMDKSKMKTADSTSADDLVHRTWSDWAVDRTFVPFVQVTIMYLLNEMYQNYNFQAGDRMVWHPTEKVPMSYTLVHPEPDAKPQADGKPEAAKKEPKLERLGMPDRNSINGRLEVTAKSMNVAGIYYVVTSPAPKAGEEEVTQEKIDPKKNGSPIAVVPDLRESEDLTCLSDEAMDALLGFKPNHILAGSGQQIATDTERLNREWTIWLLLAVLVLTLGECMLAYICGRSW